MSSIEKKFKKYTQEKIILEHRNNGRTCLGPVAPVGETRLRCLACGMVIKRK